MKPTPQLFRYVRPLLSIIIVVGSFAFLFILVFHGIPEVNQAILNIAAGLILGILSNVASYYYGSSKDKSDQEQARVQSDIVLAEKEVETATVNAQTATVNTQSTTP